MQINLTIPEQYLIDHTPTELGQQIKLFAALFMFRSGKLSAGAAAEFAEIDRFTFAAECSKYGISLLDYPAEDLKAEITSLPQAS
jgi:predicted HTH domain antitoxin